LSVEGNVWYNRPNCKRIYFMEGSSLWFA